LQQQIRFCKSFDGTRIESDCLFQQA